MSNAKTTGLGFEGCFKSLAPQNRTLLASRLQAFNRQHVGLRSAITCAIAERSRRVCITTVVCSAASQPAQAPNKPPVRKQPGDWNELRRIQKEGESVKIKLEKMARSGGKFMLHGVQGFIPYSAMDFKRLGGALEDVSLDFLAGKTLTVKLLQVSEEEGRLLASEVAYLRQQLAEQLEEGEIVEGIVSRCTDYGAYVQLSAGKEKSLQSVEGLIHISELSWNRIFTPEAVVCPGDIVRCLVIKTDAAAGKIFLSLKRMEPDPLKERLDTVLPLQEAEQMGAIVSEVPSSIEDILQALKRQPGIEDAALGRQAEEKRSVSQDLEVWMSTTEVQDGFALIARAGRLLQEIRITTKLSKDELRGITQKVLKQLSSR